MIELYLRCPNPAEDRRARYVFEALFSTLGLPWRLVDSVGTDEGSRARLIVSYGDLIGADLRAHVAAGGGLIHIFRDSTLSPDPSPGQAQGGRISDPNPSPWQREGLGGFALSPSPWQGEGLGVRVEETGPGFLATVEFDLVAATWRCLSGLEGEAGMLREDTRPGNCPGGRNEPDPAQTPWVNQYLALLLQVIRQGFTRLGRPLIQKWYWPGGQPFAASLSHDVDRIRRHREFFLLASNTLRSLRLLAHFRFNQARHRLALVGHLLIAPEDPLANFRRLLDLERAHGFRSSFHFLGGPRWWRRYGARYDLKAAETRQIIATIAAQGCEVGLHGSYYAYEVEGGLRQEKQELEALLGKFVQGHRQHYLHMHLPDAWRVQESACLVYDTTYGYHAKAGFKAGICFPFFPYDVEAERPFRVLELPLIFMDSNYSQILSQQGWELIWPLLQTVKQYSGLITFNFHSCAVDKRSFPGWLDLYARLLDYLQEQAAFVAPGAEIAAWWQQRNDLKFVAGQQTAGGATWLLKAGQPICHVHLKIYGCPGRPALRVTGPVEYQITGEDQTWGIEIKELAPGTTVEIQVGPLLNQETGKNVEAQTIR